MNEYSAAEKHSSENAHNKKSQDAQKSLRNYMNQLKIHFDLDDEEVTNILESVIKSRKNNNSLKKWWQIWS